MHYDFLLLFLYLYFDSMSSTANTSFSLIMKPATLLSMLVRLTLRFLSSLLISPAFLLNLPSNLSALASFTWITFSLIQLFSWDTSEVEFPSFRLLCHWRSSFEVTLTVQKASSSMWHLRFLSTLTLLIQTSTTSLDIMWPQEYNNVTQVEYFLN